jgi:hypothetical protein
VANLNLSVLKSTDTATNIGTGYDLTKKVPLEQDLFARAQINIWASMLEVQMRNIAGATKITCRLSRDPSGDDYVLTSTQTDIDVGLTTDTSGTALIRLDVIIRDVNDQILYLHIKTNAGTLDIVSAGLTFQY